MLSATCPGHVLGHVQCPEFCQDAIFCRQEDTCLLWVMCLVHVRSLESQFINYIITTYCCRVYYSLHDSGNAPIQAMQKINCTILQSPSCGLPQWDCLACQQGVHVFGPMTQLQSPATNVLSSIAKRGCDHECR